MVASHRVRGFESCRGTPSMGTRASCGCAQTRRLGRIRGLISSPAPEGHLPAPLRHLTPGAGNPTGAFCWLHRTARSLDHVPLRLALSSSHRAVLTVFAAVANVADR